MGTPGQEIFTTADGLAVPAVTEEGMREVDRIAVEDTGPALFQMMENAGRNLALQAIDMMGPAWASSKVVVLAGTGGNGGGGICAARHLANRGADVTLSVTRVEGLGEVPAYQRHVFLGTQGREASVGELPADGVGLVIDALLGYSLKGAPRGAALEAIRWANACAAPKLSLDVPSGVNSTTGDTPGEYIKPAATLTLALPKTGLKAHLTGDLILADIGIPVACYQKMGLKYQSPFGAAYRVPLRQSDSAQGERAAISR
ncbi:unnamed protein product [Ostreobium quekettii]|uniref:NAD(P)H-hydrate epimerase n=1 Tax=Ostreobium quekettii TaxID=121088 RepID=A0A8S1JA29_9CHLO|nr:unnamed protein product [Ostreobium quekettii]|eukprot:evm.model.scf_2680.2 EVM.evm.TU.scf_2680.2   scf_2680:16349-18283(+)